MIGFRFSIEHIMPGSKKVNCTQAHKRTDTVALLSFMESWFTLAAESSISICADTVIRTVISTGGTLVNIWVRETSIYSRELCEKIDYTRYTILC